MSQLLSTILVTHLFITLSSVMKLARLLGYKKHVLFEVCETPDSVGY